MGWAHRTRGEQEGQVRGSVGGASTAEGRTIGFEFNLTLQSADGGEMSDVDAIRWMASEHDLEFVDLDTYGVDPAAGEILPAPLARRHHVVAIKRRFGTPVIATADPDDLNAQDNVRASIGRDFISVVASREQISDYLDQLFGPESAESVPEPGVSSSDDAEVPDDTIADSLEGLGSDPSDTDLAMFDTEGRDAEDDGRGPGAGPDWSGDPASTLGGEPDPSGQPEYSFAAHDESAGDGPIDPDAGPDSFSGGPRSDSRESVATFESPIDQPAGFDKQTDLDIPTLEPATNLLPAFGPESSYPPPPPPLPSNALAASAQELAELARSVEGGADRFAGGPEAPTDNTEFAADLVAEAVANYQEQQGDDQGFEPVFDAPDEVEPFPSLAEALVAGERVSEEDMESVLEEHEETGQSVARILTNRKLVTEVDLMWGMAQEMGLEFVDLDSAGIDLTEVGSIPEATARHHNVIVIANDDGVPVVAASNPTDVFAMDDLRTIMGRRFKVVVATRTQISAAIGRAFNTGDAADMAMEASLGFDGVGHDDGVDDIQSVTEEAPIVRYVNLLILQALNERASDIHVEPTATDLRIRYRIDGVLHDVSTAPRAISAAVITRLKVMADMNVAEHRVPQDGRISLNVGAKGIDLRMATLPTIHGEKVVMRVLDKSSVVLGFADLGFDDDLLKTYESIYTKPYGTILVTGPTGSGKSTTLYTTLTALNSPEKNIITVEDPVELQLKGVNQVQLNVKAGLTFASALKSILRSDPDIVLVGEIRDKETATIAIEAALTGHMVLATLHTNDSASTPMRLIEMGLEPFLVTSSHLGCVGPAAGPAAVHALQGTLRAHRSRYRRSRLEAGRGGGRGGHAAGVPSGGLFRLCQHRLPGTEGPGRTHAYDRGDRTNDYRRRIRGRNSSTRGVTRNGDSASERAA